MQASPKWMVCLTPDHALTGWGACQLPKAPTGGAAKGMPLNSPRPSAAAPAILPPVTLASVICAIAGAPAAIAARAAIDNAHFAFMSVPPTFSFR